MVYQNFALPPAPVLPLSILSITKHAAMAYRATFSFAMRLFWLPCMVMTLGTLACTLAEAPSSFSIQELLRVCGISFFSISCGLFFLWHTVRRGLVLQRMVIFAEETCIPSLAFANRLGHKAVFARAATGAFQFFTAFVFIFFGVLAWCNNENMHLSLQFHLAPDLSIPFIGIVVSLTALSYFCWFFSEFFFMCFSVVLATEIGTGTELLARSWQLARSSFWRGTNFAFLSGFIVWLFSVLLTPLALSNLMTGIRGGLDALSGNPSPVWFVLIDSAVSFALLLLTAPFFAILSACFANDVRLRHQTSLSNLGN